MGVHNLRTSSECAAASDSAPCTLPDILVAGERKAIRAREEAALGGSLCDRDGLQHRTDGGRVR
jgi:hypothetical protein